MSFPAYGSYKESGVEWLGQAPSHWTIMPLKRDLDFLTSGSRGWADHYADDGALFIRIGNLTRDRLTLDLDDIQRVNVPPGAEGERTQVQPGDLLFSITAYLGSVAVVPEQLETAYVSQHVALARLRAERLLPTWVGYVALSWLGKTYLETRGYGGTKIQLSLDDIAEMVMTAPPLAEQHAIAAFLDRETAKIDALVEAQRRLIELLKEKRQAVISHAVTKGLDPSAPTKDSGVEWLGQVPAHWEVLPVRRFATRVQTGTTPTSEPASVDTEEGMDWFTPGDFGSGIALSRAAKRISWAVAEDGEARVFPAGSVLVIGIGATLGRVGVALAACSANQQINAISPDDSVGPFFLAYALSVQEEIMRKLSNASTIGIMNQDRTKDLCLCRPPVQEQKRIVEWLDDSLVEFGGLIGSAEAAITLLQERRAALISAAVTGKIDVRGLAATVLEASAA